MLHMFSLQRLLYNWLALKNKTRKITKKGQLVLLYYCLVPVEDVTIYTQVMLHWMDSPPKHSSSNCTWPWDFYNRRYWNLTSIFLSKTIKVFQWRSKLRFLSFITIVNPSNGNEKHFRHFFMGHIHIWLKYSKDFYNWHLSISLENWAQANKMK